MTRPGETTRPRRLAPRAALLLLALGLPASPRAVGQTIQGDIIRAEGSFYRNFGWYELNSARAASINVDTWSRYNREVQRLYRDYMQERAMNLARKKGLVNKSQAAALKEYQEAQSRYRLGPTAEDITSGMALNALAGDLADANIHPSSWRSAKVELPAGMTLTSLSFKVVGVPGLHSKLKESTVAVDRMKVAGGWSLPFRRPELDAECKSYLAWIGAVLAKCRKGTPLESKDFENLRATVEVLKNKVALVVPARDNLRRQAQDYVRDLDDATKIFADQGFAEELIRDIEEHKATTVAELLGFMRKYRLVFAETEATPDAMQTYDALYQALQQQKAKLDLPKVPAGGIAAVAAESYREIPLFNGKNLAGWTALQRGHAAQLGVNLIADRGTIYSPANVQGRIRTARAYSNFILKLEYLFPEDGKVSPAGNALILFPADGAGFQLQKVKTKGPVEFNLRPGESGELRVVGRPEYRSHTPAGNERPKGQWNEAEIRFEGAVLVFSVNGKPASQAIVQDPRPCHIDLFAQGTDARYRNIRIVSLGDK